MSQSQSGPNDDIRISDIFINGELFGGEGGSLGVVRSRGGNHHLLSWHFKLVGHWLTGDWVDGVFVDDFVSSVSEWRLLNRTWFLNDGSLADITDTVRVNNWVDFHRNVVVVTDSVVVTVQSGVESERQQMLVEGSHDTWPDCGTPWNRDTFIDRHGGQDPSGSDLNSDGTNLIEDEVDDVLVVTNSGDGLDNEFSSSGDDIVPVSEVHVLEQDPIVLLVHTNSVGELDWGPFTVDSHTVQVLNDTKTVTAQVQLVGSDTEPSITQVKSLLSVVWDSGITVRNSHFVQSDSVEKGSTLEVDVVQHNTFSGVGDNSELPALPFNFRASDAERDTIWLFNDQRLQVSELGFTVQIRVVFNSRDLLPWLSGTGLFVQTGRQEVHSDKLFRQHLEDRRELNRQGVMVSVIVLNFQVDVTLDQWLLLLISVSSVHPWVTTNFNVIWQLQLVDLSHDSRMGLTNLFNGMHVLR
ncbi:hypothetical protein WICPIJ_001460 [Wickerhamomyces pijperi]|uniref:Uncharacterized protein n=1 Tax=Wickerhamomyces pijperi TaxID=599730 RepID=A0A9P8TQS3_WICPI|nr:hypothetical protein WICPIJ_001460 [Wickerhamomyces pijperi]